MSRKTQEGHLEEGKAAKPIKGTKNGKRRKMAKKSQEKLKTEIERARRKAQSPISPLKRIPPNTLNASSPR
jgi:hypothetical protein